jgi:tRNA A37 threonylcarbamoyladenosine synthetase subunit TsaC/SUA5/YrdC
VRAFKNEHDLKSVHIVRRYKGITPQHLASQIIGFTGTDKRALRTGAIYNKNLQGVNGALSANDL